MSSTALGPVDAAIAARNTRRDTRQRTPPAATRRVPGAGEIAARLMPSAARPDAAPEVRSAADALHTQFTAAIATVNAIHEDGDLVEDAKWRRSKEVALKAMDAIETVPEVTKLQKDIEQGRARMSEAVAAHTIPPSDPHELGLIAATRTHLQNMTPAGRLAFLTSRIEQGDKLVIQALATTPGWMFELDDSKRSALLNRAARKLYPEQMQRLEMLDATAVEVGSSVQRAREMIAAAAGLRFVRGEWRAFDE